MNPSLCVNCKHHRVESFSINGGTLLPGYSSVIPDTNVCRRESPEVKINLVTGKKETLDNRVKHCGVEREAWDNENTIYCGPSGRYFKEK